MMPYLRLILTASAIVAFNSVSLHAQAPPAPAAIPQPAQTANSKDNQVLTTLVNDAKVQGAAQDTQIAALQKQLDDLRTQLANAPNAITLAALTQRISVIEQAQKTQSDLATQQSKKITDDLVRQYQAGYAALSLMDDNAHNLDFAFQLGNDLTTFQLAVNPMNNATFTTDVESLLSRQTNDAIPSLTSNGAIQSLAAANPWVSLGISVASYFTSKLRSSAKDPKLAEIGCIVNVATSSTAASEQIQSQLAALQDRISKFQKSCATVFVPYVKIVSYAKSIDDYREEHRVSPTDPLAQGVADTFKPGGTGSTPAGVLATRYQIEQVKAQMAQFDSLIQDVGDFLLKFNSVLSDQVTVVTKAGCAGSALQQLTVLKTTVANLKPTFDGGNWSIPPDQRALILGVASSQ
jgi:hypothetical protein